MTYNAALRTASGALVTPGQVAGSLRAGVLGPAALRTRLTQIPQGGTFPSTSGSTGNTSFIRLYCLEAVPRTIRVLFPGSLFNTSMHILGCGAVGLSSFAPWAASESTFSGGFASACHLSAPTGAIVSRVFFDNAGAWGTPATDAINFAGTNAGYTVPAVPANTTGAAGPYTIVASDTVPFFPVPRTDGHPGWLVAVMVTISGTGLIAGADNEAYFVAFNKDATANRNRFAGCGYSWNVGSDYSQDVTAGGGGWNGSTITPFLGIQYDTEYPGLQISMAGDSGSVAPTTDNYSQPIRRAAWDLSTSTLPVEVANFGWGGVARSAYSGVLTANAGLVRPSALLYQPLSRNDGFDAQGGLTFLLANGLNVGDAVAQLYGTRLVWNTPICEPSYDNSSSAQAAFTTLLDALRTASAATGIPHIDRPSVLGQPLAQWDYITSPAVSDDNTHFNSIGAELEVPMCRAALRAMLPGLPATP